VTTRLTPADAMALHAQTPTTPAHTVSVVILDASVQLSHGVLAQHVAEAVSRLARFRSRLVGKPLGMGQPVWADIEDFDPTGRIHSAQVPAPGGDRELAELVTQLGGRPDSLRDSLWEAWTIGGLAGSRWAVAVYLSPVLAEGGQGVAALWDTVLTRTPHAEAASAEPGLGSAPSVSELVADMLSEMVENQITGAWLAADAAMAVLVAARDRLRDVGPPAQHDADRAPMPGPVPITAFNAPLTKRRSLALVSTRRTDLQIVRDAFGGSAENVLLAACTLALGAWLQRHDVVPDVPLVLAVAEGQVQVPVQLDDPVQVLTNMHTATQRANPAGDLDETPTGAGDLTKVVSMLWPWAARAGMQVYSGLGLAGRGRVTCHASISFVASSADPLFCAGVEVVGIYTAQPLAAGCGPRITVTSHADTMNVCVSACPDNVPIVDDIARGVADAVDVLLAAARRSPRGCGRSVVSEMTSYGGKRA
jgi:diacylglycerol O-acyltransferase